METGLSEPSPLAKRSRVHFGSNKVHIFEESSSELGATHDDDIDVAGCSDDAHSDQNGGSYTNDHNMISDNIDHNNDISDNNDKFDTENNEETREDQKSLEQGTPELLRVEKKEKESIFLDEGTTDRSVLAMCVQKSANQKTVSAGASTDTTTVDGNYFASLDEVVDEVSYDFGTPRTEDRPATIIEEEPPDLEDDSDDEDDDQNILEVQIHSVLYDKHSHRGLEAVRAAGIPKPEVDYIAISEWTPVVAEDNLVFATGQIGKDVVYMQVDDGSQISCIHREQLQALGLEGGLVKRPKDQRRRVRGIGTKPGEGELITEDIWLRIRVSGSEVVAWQTADVAPVEGDPRSMLIEGWFAVLGRMGVPMLVGGDILAQFDVISRPKHQCIVFEDIHHTQARVVIPSLSMRQVLNRVRHSTSELYSSPVWHDMARSVSCSGEDDKVYNVNGGMVPPGKMRIFKVRYTKMGQVPEDAIFGVEVERSNLRVASGVDQRSKVVFATGWDPQQDDPCFGYPTVKVANLTNEWLEVKPLDIQVKVRQYQVTTRYVQVDTRELGREGELPQVHVHHARVEPAVRPEEFPERLWDLVHPDEQPLVQERFAKYPKERLLRCIDEILYDLDVHADKTPVERPPWEAREEHVSGDDPHRSDEVVGEEGDGVINQTQPTKRSRAHPRNLDARVSDYFKDTARIKSEMERQRQR